MQPYATILSTGLTCLASMPLQAAIVAGYIQVRDSNQLSIGYIANSYETLGEYGLTSAAAERLLISFDDSSAIFSVATLNGEDSSFGFLGAIVGYSTTDDFMGSGNPNYLYLGGTNQSAVGATPTVGANSFSEASSVERSYESAIWTISGDSLLYQWINPDSSASPLTAVLSQNLILLTGDASAFEEAFGSGQVVSLKFVPIPEPNGNLIAAIGGIFVAVTRRKRNFHQSQRTRSSLLRARLT